MISIVLILMLFAAFANRIIDTLDKVLINSSTSASNANDPVAFNLTTNTKDRFMFGMEVYGHNLNAGSRIFDVDLIRETLQYGTQVSSS